MGDGKNVLSKNGSFDPRLEVDESFYWYTLYVLFCDFFDCLKMRSDARMGGEETTLA